MDFLLFFFSKSISTSRASEPLTTKSSTRSTYHTISDKSNHEHRKALFDRLPSCEPRARSRPKSTLNRRGSDGSGIASLDLLLLLDRHGYFS
jgi:hypothetical protein